ncbi:hypothetical protein O181_004017 [Austropuccinia psidii MF-1]|uniref:Uncharacterized protein n=1 Tax=Austropuccinia psidii MF-1 TaxID=1389203 RepID=A0A9Q3BFG0_9BASI|nr:hypothetical protein [Austropuccinia psidii MF-1]
MATDAGQEDPNLLQSLPSYRPRFSPEAIMATWISKQIISGFESSQLSFVLPFFDPSSHDSPSQIGHDQTWIDSLIRSKTRTSFYLGEQTKIYVILTISKLPFVLDDDGSKNNGDDADQSSDEFIRSVLCNNLSFTLEANIIQDSHLDHRFGPSNQPSALVNAAKTAYLPNLSQPIQLFTSTYSHVSPNREASEPFAVNHSNILANSSHINQSSNHQVNLRIVNVDDQWFVVWETTCQIPHAFHSNPKSISISLSATISYYPFILHSSNHKPFLLSTLPFSQSPPPIEGQQFIHPPQQSPLDYGTTINLFEGMGRDLFVPLTYPSSSSSQLHSTHLPHQHRPHSKAGPINRIAHSYSSPKDSPNRNLLSSLEDCTPASPIERRQSAPSISSNCLPATHQLHQNFNVLGTDQNNPSTTPIHLIEKHHSLSIPLIEPLTVKARVAFVHDQIQSLESTIEKLAIHKDTLFIERERSTNFILMLEICHSSPNSNLDLDFLLENVSINIQDHSTLSEFDQFEPVSFQITPLLSENDPNCSQDPPNHSNISCRLAHHNQYNLIYSIKNKPADFLLHRAHDHLQSSLTTRAPISNFEFGLQNHNARVSTALYPSGFTDHKTLSESIPVGNAQLSKVVENVSDSSNQLFPNRHPFESLHKSKVIVDQSRQPQLNNVSYLLSVTVRGKMVVPENSHSSQVIEEEYLSTSVISSRWCTLFNPWQLSKPASLSLTRQSFDDNPRLNSNPPSNSHNQTDIHSLSVNQCNDLIQGQVAGSKLYCASNLLNTLNKSRHPLGTDQKQEVIPIGINSTRPSDIPSTRWLASHGSRASFNSKLSKRRLSIDLPIHQKPSGKMVSKTTITGSWMNEQLVAQVKLCKHQARFRILEEFSIEIIITNRCQQARGGFAISKYTNRKTDSDGLIVLDEPIEIGQLNVGESESGKIKMIGTQKGICQIEGIEILEKNNFHQTIQVETKDQVIMTSGNQNQISNKYQDRHSKFVLINPITILID